MNIFGAAVSVPNGSQNTYGVSVTNSSSPGVGCNVRDVLLTFCCPDADGQPIPFVPPATAGCSRIPITSAPCNVNDPGANCTPTAAANAGLTFLADGSDNLFVSGLVCTINVKPGVTVAFAQANIDDYVLVETEAGIPQIGFSQVVPVDVVAPTPTNTPM